MTHADTPLLSGKGNKPTIDSAVINQPDYPLHILVSISLIEFNVYISKAWHKRRLFPRYFTCRPIGGIKHLLSCSIPGCLLWGWTTTFIRSGWLLTISFLGNRWSRRLLLSLLFSLLLALVITLLFLGSPGWQPFQSWDLIKFLLLF